uniref:Intercellular adhesion molecule 4 n=1 Tax=Fundulus heteroclitus TaxID=8078 RepID=A0A3Q2PWB6_FUNHE
MCAAGWMLALVLICLIGSATSLALITPAPPLPSHISPPSTNLLPPTSSGGHAELVATVDCNLKISPSVLVVRFGDPAKANCSKPSTGFLLLGWENIKGGSLYTMENFLVLSVDNITEWSINPICFATSDLRGPCNISLPLIVYKPPERVSIQFSNHTGPMFENHNYTLQCTVQNVAPVGKLVVTFYRGQTPLGRFRSSRIAEKTPVNETFTLIVTPHREDNGSQYWCEAKLELGPTGPQHPPVEMSQNLPVMVLWNPEVQPTKLHMKEEKCLECEVETTQPLGGRGSTNSYRGGFISIALLAHLINGL